MLSADSGLFGLCSCFTGVLDFVADEDLWLDFWDFFGDVLSPLQDCSWKRLRFIHENLTFRSKCLRFLESTRPHRYRYHLLEKHKRIRQLYGWNVETGRFRPTHHVRNVSFCQLPDLCDFAEKGRLVSVFGATAVRFMIGLTSVSYAHVSLGVFGLSIGDSGFLMGFCGGRVARRCGSAIMSLMEATTTSSLLSERIPF